jgi:hypothetical protein
VALILVGDKDMIQGHRLSTGHPQIRLEQGDRQLRLDATEGVCGIAGGTGGGVRSGRGHGKSKRRGNAKWAVGHLEVIDARWGGVDNRCRAGAGKALRRREGVGDMRRRLEREGEK